MADKEYSTYTITILEPGVTPRVCTFTVEADAVEYLNSKVFALSNEAVLQVQRHTVTQPAPKKWQRLFKLVPADEWE